MTETDALYDATAAAALYFTRWFAASGVARAYWQQRGFTPAQAVEYGAGYGGDDWGQLQAALAAEGIAAETAVAAGLLAAGKRGLYGRFTRRLTFTIAGAAGGVAGFGGRTLEPRDDVAKYLNSPASPIYDKAGVLYGAERAQGDLVVVEGYFDAARLWACGVTGAVATCGTALTAGHAAALAGIDGAVTLCFDGDAAGVAAAIKAAPVLVAAGLDVRVAALPPGDDPDTFGAREGAAGVAAALAGARPAGEFVVPNAREAAADAAAARFGRGGGGWRVAHAAAGFIATMPPGLARDIAVDTVLHRLGFDADRYRPLFWRDLRRKYLPAQ